MEISYGTYNDDCLVNLMGRGDNLAFAALYERHSSRLLNYAISITGDKRDAAIMLQEIFMSLWNGRREIVLTHGLKEWLFQAVRLHAVRYINHSERKKAFLAALGELVNTSDLAGPVHR